MSNIAIQKVREAESLPRQLSEEMESIAGKVRNKAYELFLMRGASPGHDTEDWLQAERQLMWMPDSEVIEKERDFQVHIDVEGIYPGDIHIIALPDSIVLQAELKSRETKLFQRFYFSRPIDLDKVTAKLEKGVLEVNAPKARTEKALAA
jgi:HSP20 family molecular chaperone IbpA